MSEAVDPVTRRQLLARAARAQRDGRLPSLGVLVSDDRGTAWWAGRGQVAGGPPTTDTQYRIGSITKTFTAVLVLQLRDEGRLRLSDPVEHWLPGAPALAGRTVAELLDHSGGVRAETAPPWWERSPGRTWDEVLADLDEPGARHAARGRHHYSNVGYAALGRVISCLRGAAWPEVLERHLLAPLGLRRTTMRAVPPAADGWAVHPWSAALVPEPAHDTGAMAPAGQLWSTVEDLGAWGRFLLDGADGVLAAATLEELRQPRVTTDRGAGDAYGLGLELRAVEGRTLAGHGGSMPGFVADLRIDCDERLVAVALANATAGLDPTLLPDLLDTVRRRHPRIVDEWRPADRHDHDVEELLGLWFWGPRPYTVTAGDEPRVLALDAVGATGRSTLLDLRGARWLGRGGYFDGEPLVVVRRDDGEVSHLELASFVFTREPYTPAERPG